MAQALRHSQVDFLVRMVRDARRRALVACTAALTLLPASPSLAYSLRSYREHLNIKTNNEAAEKKLTELRTLLGTAHLKFNSLSDPQGPFLAYPAQSDYGKKHTASAVYKTFLNETAQTIRERVLREQPMLFDPSDFLSEVKQKVEAKKAEYCQENVMAKLPTVVNELAVHFLKQKNEPVNKTDVMKETEKQRKIAISKYIADFQPRNSKKRIEEKIGQLSQVEFVDGHVVRLVFLMPKSETDRDALPLSLSMLLTFRSGLDNYFVGIQECLMRYLGERLSNARKGPEEKKILELVKEESAPMLSGTQFIHKLLQQLTRSQVDFLLDLFLQFRGNDIPLEAEMESGIDECKGKNDSVVCYIRDFEITQAKNKPAETLAMRLDYRFYHLMSTQLYEFENFLREEKANQLRKQSIVEDIRKKKK